MGFFEDLGNAVAGAVDVVADAVEGAAAATGQVVEDVVETVGNGVADAAEGLADTIQGTPVVGGFLAAATSWLGGFGSELIGLVGGILSGVFSIVGGLLGGLTRIIGGIALWNAKLVIEGWADIGTAFAGAGMLIGGKILSTVQVLVFAQNRKRRLTKEEMLILRRVFRSSIALYNVRIVDGNAGLFDINARPFTLGNTIYLKTFDTAHHPADLVHESTHAWQYQHRGARYAMDAVWAQNYVLPDAYDWEAEVDRGHTAWIDFNLEAQAEFFQDVYTVGEIQDSFGSVLSAGGGRFYDADSLSVGTAKFIVRDADHIVPDVDHTDRANTAIAFVRSQMNFRPSQFLFS